MPPPPHSSARHPSAGRFATAVLAAVALGAAGAGVAATWQATAQLRRPSAGGFDDLLVAGAAWLLVVCLTWLGLLLAVAVVDTWSAERFGLLHRVGCPPRLRSVLLSLVGAGLVLHLPTAAAAAPPTSWPEPAPDTAPAASWEVTGSAATRATPSIQAPGRAVDSDRDPAPRGRSVVVSSGDSLWSIVAADLDRRPVSPPGAGPRDGLIARRVGVLHASNRDRIGADPDLIVPGQRLRLPWHAHPGPAPATSPSHPIPPTQQSQPNEPKEHR